MALTPTPWHSRLYENDPGLQVCYMRGTPPHSYYMWSVLPSSAWVSQGYPCACTFCIFCNICSGFQPCSHVLQVKSVWKAVCIAQTHGRMGWKKHKIQLNLWCHHKKKGRSTLILVLVNSGSCIHIVLLWEGQTSWSIFPQLAVMFWAISSFVSTQMPWFHSHSIFILPKEVAHQGPSFQWSQSGPSVSLNVPKPIPRASAIQSRSLSKV